MAPALLQFATASRSSNLWDVLPWLGVLMIVAIVGGVIILIARRMASESSESAAVGFTLHDLRQLHAAGELSDEEFARARDSMIGRVRANASPQPEDEPSDEADEDPGGGLQSPIEP